MTACEKTLLPAFHLPDMLRHRSIPKAFGTPAIFEMMFTIIITIQNMGAFGAKAGHFRTVLVIFTSAFITNTDQNFILFVVHGDVHLNW
jgi:hypothetical protein